MNRQPNSIDREIVVAEAIKDVVSELRMVDVADYIAFIRLERFSCIADIVQSASELYLMPGTLVARTWRGTRGWPGKPSRRSCSTWSCGQRVPASISPCTWPPRPRPLRVNYVSFDSPAEDPDDNTAYLAASLENARIRKEVGDRGGGAGCLSAMPRPTYQSKRPARSALATACMRLTAFSFCVVLARYWLAVWIDSPSRRAISSLVRPSARQLETFQFAFGQRRQSGFGTDAGNARIHRTANNSRYGPR